MTGGADDDDYFFYCNFCDPSCGEAIRTVHFSWWPIVKDKVMAWEILTRCKVGFQVYLLTRCKVGFQVFHHSPDYRLIAAFIMIPYRIKSPIQS